MNAYLLQKMLESTDSFKKDNIIYYVKIITINSFVSLFIFLKKNYIMLCL